MKIICIVRFYFYFKVYLRIFQTIHFFILLKMNNVFEDQKKKKNHIDNKILVTYLNERVYVF